VCPLRVWTCCRLPRVPTQIVKNCSQCRLAAPVSCSPAKLSRLRQGGWGSKIAKNSSQVFHLNLSNAYSSAASLRTFFQCRDCLPFAPRQHGMSPVKDKCMNALSSYASITSGESEYKASCVSFTVQAYTEIHANPIPFV
jgi:hypothetical protein